MSKKLNPNHKGLVKAMLCLLKLFSDEKQKPKSLRLYGVCSGGGGEEEHEYVPHTLLR